MTKFPVNDDEPGRAYGDPHQPDAHGQAAVLLVESLIHGLMERSVLTLKDAIEIVATATEVQAEVLAEDASAQRPTQTALALLETIQASLEGDLPDEGPAPASA